MSGSIAQPVIRGCRFFVAHVPGLVRFGAKPQHDIERDAAVDGRIAQALRSYEAARDYPPNQVLLGALHPDSLAGMPRPWFREPAPAKRWGPHGEIMPEEEFFGLLDVCDQFDLVSLDHTFVNEIRPLLAAHPLVTPGDLERLGTGVPSADIDNRLHGPLPARPLCLGSGRRIGCIVAGHEDDGSLAADVLLENLACKATAVMALRTLLDHQQLDPTRVEYVVNAGEEAVGDRYQRGGGNLGKAVAEQSGCGAATGVDVKGFCCGPLHALVIAGGLVGSRVFERVAVVAGGSLAKLGMKYQGHLRHGQPILEDVLVGMAAMVTADDGRSARLRLDTVGRHPVSAGPAPRAILEHLVAAPLARAGLGFRDVDRYATELHNPEATEPAGSGNVPLLNYRALAGLAALRGEIAVAETAAFVTRHGMPGFSPTQGHIASAVPFLAHAIDGLEDGSLRRAMFLAKGSLFLGRMTQLADGLSFILDRNPAREAHTGREAR